MNTKTKTAPENLGLEEGKEVFVMVAASTDYLYFGLHDLFDSLTFTIPTHGSYGTLTWQYSQGAGNRATITVTDGTSKFSRSGA